MSVYKNLKYFMVKMWGWVVWMWEGEGSRSWLLYGIVKGLEVYIEEVCSFLMDVFVF